MGSPAKPVALLIYGGLFLSTCAALIKRLTRSHRKLDAISSTYTCGLALLFVGIILQLMLP